MTLEGRLVDVATGQEIWSGTATASSSENNSGNSAGVVGVLVEALVTQVVEEVFDASYLNSKIATARLLSPEIPNALLCGGLGILSQSLILCAGFITFRHLRHNKIT